MMFGVSGYEDRASIWNEVAALYGEGASPFGFFSLELVKAAGLASGDRVLDLGTGNGLGLIPAALVVAPAIVTGVDFSPDMLEYAKQRALAARVPNVELRQMDVTRLDFPDDSFDVAIASSVFQFVGYAPEVLVEWRRVLRPGGRLVFSVPKPDTDATMHVLLGLLREHEAELPAKTAARLRAVRTPPDLPALCLESGFNEASGGRLRHEAAAADVDEWWEVQWSHGVRTFLRELTPATLDEIKHAAAAKLDPFRRDDGAIPIVLEMAVCHAVK